MSTVLEKLREMVHDKLEDAYELPATGYEPDGTRVVWKLEHENIYGIAGTDFHVYINGAEVLPADYTLDATLGMITFDTAPALKATLEFVYKYSDFTDTWLQEMMNKYLTYLSEGPGGGNPGYPLRILDDDYKIWVSDYKFIDSSGFASYDSDGSTITPSVYDYINGRFEFTSEYSSGVFIKGRSYDVKECACEIWKYRAAVAENLKHSLGTERIEVEDKYSRDFCLKQVMLFSESKSIQASR